MTPQTEQQHTPEPWHVNLAGIVAGEHGNIAKMAGASLEGDARRIVACVNALDGVDTEALETAAELAAFDDAYGDLTKRDVAMRTLNRIFWCVNVHHEAARAALNESTPVVASDPFPPMEALQEAYDEGRADA